MRSQIACDLVDNVNLVGPSEAVQTKYDLAEHFIGFEF